MNADVMASVSAFGIKILSDQQMNRSAIVRQYPYPLQQLRWPTTSKWTCKKRSVAVANWPKGATLSVYLCFLALHASGSPLASLSLHAGQVTNFVVVRIPELAKPCCRSKIIQRNYKRTVERGSGKVWSQIIEPEDVSSQEKLFRVGWCYLKNIFVHI